MHEQLLPMTDGTVADTEAALTGADAGEVAALVLAEVAGRTRFFDGPAEAVTVQFDLGLAGRRIGYRVVVGPAAAEVVPGWGDDPDVRIRQDLAELLRAVYGPPGPRPHSTREIWLNDTGEPSQLAADDPWMVRWNASIKAAGQVVRACEEFRPDLTSLALHFGSDKWGGRWYTPHYERHLAPYRQERVKVLEIGVGGYDAPDVGGASLRMWKHYFPRGLVYGLDVFDKSFVDEPRVATVVGDQSDGEVLTRLHKEIGPFDIVVDDGSHVSDHVIASFTALFPLLRPGGLYVIEDLETAYWPGYNGNRGAADPGTSTGFLKTLIDALHRQSQQPDAIEAGVTALHVYHNLAFIEKGVNAEQPAPAWMPRDSTLIRLTP